MMKKAAKTKKVRKVWLIKPFTKVKSSGKMYSRKKIKEKGFYDNFFEENKDRAA